MQVLIYSTGGCINGVWENNKMNRKMLADNAAKDFAIDSCEVIAALETSEIWERGDSNCTEILIFNVDKIKDVNLNSRWTRDYLLQQVIKKWIEVEEKNEELIIKYEYNGDRFQFENECGGDDYKGPKRNVHFDIASMVVKVPPIPSNYPDQFNIYE